MENAQFSEPSIGNRLRSVVDSVESAYLRILRVAILLTATVVISYAGWLALTSLLKIMQSPDSVKERQVAVSASDLVLFEIPQSSDKAEVSKKTIDNSVYSNFYKNFLSKYYNLFKKDFEIYKQPEDKSLSIGEFDDNFLNSEGRIIAISEGDIDFNKDKSDLDNLFLVMSQAAADPETKDRLQKYKNAKKVEVKKRSNATEPNIGEVGIATARTARIGMNRPLGVLCDEQYRCLTLRP